MTTKAQYTPCYCEENIYHLAKSQHHKDSFVVFISNEHKQVPFWRNKARISIENPYGFVIWDYHVIYLHNCEIYDFDSDVPFPCSIAAYLTQVLAIRDHLEAEVPLPFQRLYRVIRAADYITEFASDRSHMLLNGVHIATPPETACIAPVSGETMNLDRLVHLRAQDTVAGEEEVTPCPAWMGDVLSEKGFIDFLQSSLVCR